MKLAPQTRILILISLFTLMLPSFAVGQDKKIDRDQYYAAYEAADVKSEGSFPRTMEVILETFEDDKVVRTVKSTYQYQSANILRRIVDLDEKGKKTTGTYIQIDNTYYCQKNGGIFEKSSKPCELPLMGMAGNTSIESFTVKEIKSGGEMLTEYGMFKKSSPITAKGKMTVYYSEQIFRVRQDGRYAGFSIEYGSESKEKKPNMRSTIRYAYDAVFPKIEAPIK